MKSVEEIQSDIEALPRGDYMRLVSWFSEKDWNSWDQDVRSDVVSGKLDFLIDEALHEKTDGKLTEL